MKEQIIYIDVNGVAHQFDTIEGFTAFYYNNDIHCNNDNTNKYVAKFNKPAIDTCAWDVLKQYEKDHPEEVKQLKEYIESLFKETGTITNYNNNLPRNKEEEVSNTDLINWLNKEVSHENRAKDFSFTLIELYDSIRKEEQYEKDHPEEVYEHIKKYIRFGSIPENKRSGIYRGDNKIGEELGVSVYDAKFIDGRWRVVLPEKLSSKIAYSLYGLLNNVLQDEWKVQNPSNVFLVTGKEIGKGTDNEPLITNVKILKTLSFQ